MFPPWQDYPMLTWAEHQDEYLDEVLRLEGRGYAAIYSRCGGCGVADPKFRCCQQTCYGPSLYCRQCVVERHAVLPTHWIEEWNGAFFQRRSLKELGLVIQLGHPPGITCPNPLAANKAFVLIDLTGVHNVAVNFCRCDGAIEKRQQLMRVCWWPATVRDPQTCATFATVRLFQILNCQGKVSAHDFLRSLELLTNNDGLNPLPDRRRAFRHIVRQWRMTLMMKRAGRGHDPSGVKGTRQGELALQCRACPQDGKNLPEGWDRINWSEMPEDLSYKYFLFLVQDCNFRLINRNVSSAAKDPILGDGYGYFVNNARYTEFLRDYVSEEEISSCAGFQAMFLANKKRVKGLRTTGIGGVTCARHNMWLANGLGDLQLGERFCNMDFILFSVLLHIIIFYLILSYDIACQYGINFWSQMEKLPEDMKLKIEAARVWFKVPNFHLPPHRPACHSAYSFHYMWGAGRTHAETIEQNWEFSNGAAASTKMMGQGTRASTLEDLFGFHNWRRLVAWRRLFAVRMAENVKEGQVHRDAFEAFDQALRQQDAALVESWKTWVHKWESRQHTNGVESPFEYTEKVMSMRDIKLKLAKDELLRSGEGTEVEREDTPSTFILMGMEIEESQRYLTIDVKAVANPTETQTVEFLKRRATLLKRIRAFRKLQRTYMPNLRRFLTATQSAQWDSEGDHDAENIRLFLPSDISSKANREKACAVGLPEVEADLRVGEAREALNTLRQGLRTRTMTNRFRLRNCTGQRMLTRGQGVLRQVNLRVHKAKLRYRYARNALLRLRGNGPWEKELRVLEDEDVRALNERALTTEEAEQRKSLRTYDDVAEEGGIAAYGVVALGEGHRTLSWIWYTAKTGEPTEAELVEALRVEWCKAYARMRRWHEDVVLVEEEMRCTIEYGQWLAGEWNTRASGRAGLADAELQEGLTAYAREQADREMETCRMLTNRWAGVREKGRAYLAHETAPGVEIVVPMDEDGREEDEEERDPDYEDEGDDEIME
ncbi:CxC2 domain-containing protein [Mycena sanguinolenta]|uniref:CxC2 domain-containing protein n=1 Tax=Mycena sanguinolenta TaxID=230812 RepID=A0A8H6ZAJ9_9AGAR|nr:CxC2 domain-containing protein [Mycena sanguinolenta]